MRRNDTDRSLLARFAVSRAGAAGPRWFHQPRAGGATGRPHRSNGPAGPVSPAAEKPEEPPTPAEIDIDVAIKKLAKLKSVTAELIEQVNMLNQKFTVKGSYRKGPNNLSYTQLSVSGLVDSAATSLQVCDGETLWDHQMVLDSPFYRKMSIKPVLERLNSPELDPKVREQSFAQMGLCGTGDTPSRAKKVFEVQPQGRRASSMA